MPRVPWTSLASHLQSNWRLGQHVTLIGKAGCGKTHLALEVAELRPYVVVMTTKRRDPLVTDARAKGYALVESLREVPLTDEGRPIWSKVIVWPAISEPSEARRQALQARALRESLSVAERQGLWTILLDETMWAYDMLALRKELDSIWYQSRSSKISLIACAQRPTRVPRLMISNASHLFLWYVSDKRDLESLRDIAGMIPREVVEEILPTLSWSEHEFLYLDVDRGYLARSVALPR